MRWLAVVCVLASCGDDSMTPIDAPAADARIDAPPPMPDAGVTCTPTPSSNITHLVVIIQENHTFDNYFGSWCTAPTGSNPTCTQGPSCCEAAPANDPGTGMTPIALTDATNGARDPDHTQACEVDEIDGGRMDRYVNGSCGDPRNFAYADATTAAAYRTLAQQNALGDRYFQPLAGQTASNKIYFARTRYLIHDNDVDPDSIGSTCGFPAPSRMTFQDPTIADLLNQCGVSWAFYAGGYGAMKTAVAANMCPAIPTDCPAQFRAYPCIYSADDDPFAYFANSKDDPRHIKDLDALTTDLAGSAMPAVSFVINVGYKSEHPGFANKISDGVTATTAILNAIAASSYAPTTLVLLTYDEGGGYFDHVAPPPTSAIDGQPYGTRVPLIAIGPFARHNFISHTTMEHSSIVKFIEWNWLGGQTGQLGGRDTTVANIGSLLDPAATGAAVP